MFLNKKKFIFLMIILFLCVVSCDKSMKKEKIAGVVKKIDDKVIAKVNGIPITYNDFKREISKLPKSLQGLLKDNKKKEEFIDNLIVKELLYQEAKKINLDKNKKIIETIENFKKDLLINEIIKKEVKDKIYISEKEAYKFYTSNKKLFYTPEKVVIKKFIFKDYSDATNFLKNHDLKQCFNKCYSEKEKLKYLNDFPKNIQEVIKSLKPNEYSNNILFTPKGYLIVKLIKIEKGELKSFYLVKSDIIKTLKKNKEKYYFKKYIKKLQENANIIKFDIN